MNKEKKQKPWKGNKNTLVVAHYSHNQKICALSSSAPQTYDRFLLIHTPIFQFSLINIKGRAYTLVLFSEQRQNTLDSQAGFFVYSISLYKSQWYSEW